MQGPGSLAELSPSGAQELRGPAAPLCWAPLRRRSSAALVESLLVPKEGDSDLRYEDMCVAGLVTQVSPELLPTLRRPGIVSPHAPVPLGACVSHHQLGARGPLCCWGLVKRLQEMAWPAASRFHVAPLVACRPPSCSSATGGATTATCRWGARLALPLRLTAFSLQQQQNKSTLSLPQQLLACEAQHQKQ